MELVSIRENEVTVELDWADVKLLTFTIRHALSHDVGSATRDTTLTVSYLYTALAFLEAAGMASWAQTVGAEEYTVERFADVVALTPEEERRWEQRVAAARLERARWERRFHERGGKVAEVDGLDGPEYFIVRDLPPLVLLPPGLPSWKKEREEAFRVACERLDALQPAEEAPPAA